MCVYLFNMAKHYLYDKRRNRVSHLIKMKFNPIALRRAKTLWSFGRSECSRVKVLEYSSIFSVIYKKGNDFPGFLFAYLYDKHHSTRSLLLKQLLIGIGP